MANFFVSIRLLFLDWAFVPSIDRLEGNPNVGRLLNRIFVLPLRQRVANRIAAESVLLLLSVALLTLYLDASQGTEITPDAFKEWIANKWASVALFDWIRIDALLLFIATYVLFCVIELTIPSYSKGSAMPDYVAGKSRDRNPAESWLYNLFRFVPFTAEETEERKEIVRKYLDASRETTFIIQPDNPDENYRNLNNAIAMSIKTTEAAQVHGSYDPNVAYVVAGRASLARAFLGYVWLTLAYVASVIAMELLVGPDAMMFHKT